MNTTSIMNTKNITDNNISNTDNKPKTKIEQINSMIGDRELEVIKVLPRQLSFEKFRRTIVNHVANNPNLMNCTHTSIFNACMNAAELGLYPSSITGHVYLIPYKCRNKITGVDEFICQYQTGYKGYIDLVGRTKMFQHINAEAVYANDIFEIEFGSDQKIKHIPTSGDRGNIIGYYAIIYLKHGTNHPFKYMTVDTIQKYKPKKYSSTFWEEYPDQMSKKTVIKELLKMTCSLISQNYLLTRAIEIDTENEIYSNNYFNCPRPVGRVVNADSFFSG